MPAFFGQRKGGRVVIEGGDARHLAGSLRARPGESIEVVDPDGLLLDVLLDEVSSTRVEGHVVAERAHQPEPGSRITIAIANLPAQALEHVLSRCTEAGAHAFVVFNADRSVGRGQKLGRWATICREAAMLAGRLRVPEVSAASSVEAVIGAVATPVLLSREAPRRLAEVSEPRDVTLLIGPEGGWTERELELATETATLGPRNLRADTAAVVGLAVALAARGD
ncbi:MAG: 16S rRNA (uracil(1498)-N(3))-methyltransferase [Chloroflexi bacterium]|nr:MAG: 16S rRNA (uracil(1498)-N(3))-methyltransferase [Chloroflexota bacterium]TMG21574.1 MAG: 16S rRNA (uracil(1498)-N(3))-methyltransferase [Chloroflexota bacterium]TMG68426.1 MAG: 16S rRNA (uracil(1498)-N(3))-methyltransferase [Chloroflexota bacterium]